MTADLRREEIARIAEVLRKVKGWSIAQGIVDAEVLYDLGIRSQDTATARITDAATRLYDTVRLMRSTVGHDHHEPWPCPVYEVDTALHELAAIIDPTYDRRYPPDLDAMHKARIGARAVLSGETRTGGETE